MNQAMHELEFKFGESSLRPWTLTRFGIELGLLENLLAGWPVVLDTLSELWEVDLEVRHHSAPEWTWRDEI